MIKSDAFVHRTCQADHVAPQSSVTHLEEHATALLRNPERTDTHIWILSPSAALLVAWSQMAVGSLGFQIMITFCATSSPAHGPPHLFFSLVHNLWFLIALAVTLRVLLIDYEHLRRMHVSSCEGANSERGPDSSGQDLFRKETTSDTSQLSLDLRVEVRGRDGCSVR